MSNPSDPDDDRCPDTTDCGADEPYVFIWDCPDSDADGPCLEEGEDEPDDNDCAGEEEPESPLAPDFSYVVTEVDERLPWENPRTALENHYYDQAREFLDSHVAEIVGEAWVEAWGHESHVALVGLLADAFEEGYDAGVHRPFLRTQSEIREEDVDRVTLPDVPVRFGLSDEKVDVVRAALVNGASWVDIAREVSWEPATLRDYYQRAIHRFRGPLSDMQREALDYVRAHDGADEVEIIAALTSHDYEGDPGDALYGLVILGHVRWDGPNDGVTPLRYWIRPVPNKRCDGCRLPKAIEQGHRLCPDCETRILARRRTDGLPETLAAAAFLVLGKAAPETDDEVLALFSTLVGVPDGWALETDRGKGGPYFHFDHKESGTTLEVYPPGVPRMENACSWQMREAGTDRTMGWNVAYTNINDVLASRALCFERAVPRRIR